MADIADEIELTMLKEDYDALPDSAHAGRLYWVSSRGDYKPQIINGRRIVPNKIGGGTN